MVIIHLKFFGKEIHIFIWGEIIQFSLQVEDMGGQIQQNGGLPHHQGQDTKPRQVTSVQVGKRNLFFFNKNLILHCSAPIEILHFQRSLPAYARVKQSRVPNAYDKTALRLEV